MSFAQDIPAVKKALRNIFPITPLQYNEMLSLRYGANIYLKREDLTPVRSYKIRGAFNFMNTFLKENKGENLSFVCASAGNHAQGFAFSCAYFKTQGTVFMPVTTPQQKIDKTKIFGGEFIKIELIGDIFDEALKASQTFGEKTGAVMVPPFDAPLVIQGQASIGLEILEQLEEKNKTLDMVLMPVGGGGLSAGLSEYFKEMSPKTELFCVETSGTPTLTVSLKEGKLTPLDSVDTFADGTAVKMIGASNFEILKKNIKNPVQLVPENRLCQTLLEFLNQEGIVLEPSGGISIDALKNFSPESLKGKNIVCIVSGGNFDFERLPDVKERAMKYSGLKKYFVLRLPQRPGALKEFLGLLGDGDDIARFEYLKKSSRNFGSVLLGIETQKSENFPILFDKMVERGFEYQDITDDEILAEFLI